jgi:hypothetical protein
VQRATDISGGFAWYFSERRLYTDLVATGICRTTVQDFELERPQSVKTSLKFVLH